MYIYKCRNKASIIQISRLFHNSFNSIKFGSFYIFKIHYFFYLFSTHLLHCSRTQIKKTIRNFDVLLPYIHTHINPFQRSYNDPHRYRDLWGRQRLHASFASVISAWGSNVACAWCGNAISLCDVVCIPAFCASCSTCNTVSALNISACDVSYRNCPWSSPLRNPSRRTPGNKQLCHYQNFHRKYKVASDAMVVCNRVKLIMRCIRNVAYT